jgi:hypothetical protein
MTALPVIRWNGPERLAEIMRGFEAEGIGIANPHGSLLLVRDLLTLSGKTTTSGGRS